MAGYSARRYKTFLANADDRPYWMWVAIEDRQACDRCLSLSGLVFHYTDEIWQQLPPIHSGCRCHFRALTLRDVTERGLVISASAKMPARLHKQPNPGLTPQ